MFPYRCMVPKCRHDSSSKDCQIHVPQTEQKKTDWASSLGVDKKVFSSKRKGVCSHHFHPQDFLGTQSKKLKTEAIPEDKVFGEADDDPMEGGSGSGGTMR